MKNEFCGFAAGGAAAPQPPVIFNKISQPYSITVKLAI